MKTTLALCTALFLSLLVGCEDYIKRTALKERERVARIDDQRRTPYDESKSRMMYSLEEYRSEYEVRLREERADYSEAIRINPDDAEAYFNRGVVYDKMGEDDKAIADYTEAIRINPDYAKAYLNRGVDYAKNFGGYKAIADFTEAIRIKPDFAEAYHNRGIAYRKTGVRGWDKAEADFAKAKELGYKP